MIASCSRQTPDRDAGSSTGPPPPWNALVPPDVYRAAPSGQQHFFGTFATASGLQNEYDGPASIAASVAIDLCEMLLYFTPGLESSNVSPCQETDVYRPRRRARHPVRQHA